MYCCATYFLQFFIIATGVHCWAFGISAMYSLLGFVLSAVFSFRRRRLLLGAFCSLLLGAFCSFESILLGFVLSAVYSLLPSGICCWVLWAFCSFGVYCWASCFLQYILFAIGVSCWVFGLSAGTVGRRAFYSILFSPLASTVGPLGFL